MLIPYSANEQTLLLSRSLDKLINLLISLSLETEQLVVQLGELGNTGGVVDGAVKVSAKSLPVEQTLGKSLVGSVDKIVEDGLLDGPGLVRVGLLRELKDLLLGEDGVLDVDDTVLGLFGVAHDADDGIGDTGEGGGAELGVAAVDESGFGLGKVDEEVVGQTPVKEDRVVNKGVCDLVLLGQGLELLLNGNLGTEKRKSPDARNIEVGAKFGGNEALHTSSESSFDEGVLCASGKGGEGRDDGILALKRGGERLDRRVVDLDDIGTLGKGGLGAGALKDSDGEVASDKLLEDVGAEIARGSGNGDSLDGRHGVDVDVDVFKVVGWYVELVDDDQKDC